MDRLPALPHLFRSNDPPQASEVPVIESIVELIDDNIEALKAQLANVTAKRQQYQSLLSPIRRVPMDVLGEIFTYSVGSAEKPSSQTVTLCLVCKAWRDAAYATHRLWSHIEIDASRARRDWKRVESWISRSGATPKTLSVRVSTDACSGSAKGKSTKCGLARSKLVNLLAEGAAESIHTLSISCGSSQCIHSLSDAIAMANPAPSRPWDGIKSLSIIVRKIWSEGPSADELDDLIDDETFDAEEYPSFFKKLPQVTKFHLNTPTDLTIWRSANPVFPHISASPSFLSHLTTLSIDNDWDGDALVRVLQGCHQSNLEQLTFGCKSRRVDYFNVYGGSTVWLQNICGDPDKMFVLPKLRVLRFRQLHPDAFRIVFFFKAPALTELELGFQGRDAFDVPSDALERKVPPIDCEDLSMDVPCFIEASGCQASLLRLTVHGSLKLEMDDLQAWLDKKLTPSLSHLVFDGVYLPAEFFDCLRDEYSDISLDHVKTIELLNLPIELHSVGLYHRDIRKMNQGKRPYLPDTDVVITIRE